MVNYKRLKRMLRFIAGSSPSRLATNRTTETADERIAPVPESPKQKVHHDYMITTRSISRSIGRSIEADMLLVTFFCPAPLLQ